MNTKTMIFIGICVLFGFLAGMFMPSSHKVQYIILLILIALPVGMYWAETLAPKQGTSSTQA